MADENTAPYAFIKPEVGASKDTWGDKLNANWEKMDLLLGTGFTGGTPTDIGRLDNAHLPAAITTTHPTAIGTITIKPESADVNSALWFRRLDDTPAGVLYREVADDSIALLRRTAGGVDQTVLRLRTDDVVVEGMTVVPPTGDSLLHRARGDARYLQLTGGTVSGALVVTRAVSDVSLIRLQKFADAQSNIIQFYDTAQLRWQIHHEPSASGRFLVQRYNASGGYQDAPIQILPGAAGAIILEGALTVSSPVGHYLRGQTRNNTVAGLVVMGSAAGDRGFLTFNLATDISEWITINAAGSAVNVATLSPSGLHVPNGLYRGSGTNGAANLQGRYSGNRSCISWRSPDGLMTVDDGGAEFVIGTSSDYRLKDEIGPIDSPLDLISQFRPLRYHIKEATGFEAMGAGDPDIEHHGLIAHEVQELVPSLVMGEKDGETLQSINYAGLVPLLIAAVQELSAKVAVLEAA